MTDTSSDQPSYGQAPGEPWQSHDTTTSGPAVHPLDEPGRRTPVAPKPRSRASAHVGSVSLSIIAVPAALVLLDYGFSHGYTRTVALGQDYRLPNDAIICLSIAGLLLAFVGALSRLSGLGPLLAGLVWGVAPSVLVLLNPAEFASRIFDIPDPYHQFGFGIVTVAAAVFPAIGGLLVGAGLFGRWRR